MPRPRARPDVEVHEAICWMLSSGGDRAVTFGAVARAAGLAPATLAGRYGTREGMIAAALGHFWDRLDSVTETAQAEDRAPDFLTAMGRDADPRLVALSLSEPALLPRAKAWRRQVEAGLAERLGGPRRAAMMFALWQGQLMWQAAGAPGFRLKGAAKRLSQDR